MPPAHDALDVIVIGDGQAGLAVAYHLSRQGRWTSWSSTPAPRSASSWRTRWDSLRLFTPAEYDALPGMSFPASDGDYPSKDQVADLLARLRSSLSRCRSG